MMATVSKRFTFDAAHRLDRLPPDHKCHRMHGHTYEVELVFVGEVQSNGFVIDYADIAKAWDPLHERLDHRVLNEIPGLGVPSTENLAAWIFCRVQSLIAYVVAKDALPTVKLDRVIVYESSTTWCEVSGITPRERDEILSASATP